MPNIPEVAMDLLEALGELDSWLISKNKTITLKIIGGTAMSLHRLEIGRVSMDLDTANQLESDVTDKIQEIGRSCGLDGTWIEYPIGVRIPEFATFEESHLFKAFKNIKGEYIDKRSLLALKIPAYFDLTDEPDGDNHLSDIKALIDDGVPLDIEVLAFSRSEILKSPKYDNDRYTEVMRDIFALKP